MKLKSMVAVAVMASILSGQAMAEGEKPGSKKFEEFTQVITGLGFKYDLNAFYKACSTVKGEVRMQIYAAQAQPSASVICHGNNDGRISVKSVEIAFRENSIDIGASAIEDSSNAMNKQDFEEVFVPILPCAKGCDGFDVNTDRRWRERDTDQNKAIYKRTYGDMWIKGISIRPAK